MHVARPDLYVGIHQLASEVSRWSAECDRRLHKLYCYMSSHADMHLQWSLSYAKDARYVIHHWPDADLNGSPFTSKSCSGLWLEICDNFGNSFPIAWGSKKQEATASHTCEAETVSLSSSLRGEAIPAQMLLSGVLGSPVDVVIHEDNAACIIAVQKGYSPAMRYLTRTQRIALGFLHETTQQTQDIDKYGNINIIKTDTKEHKGDFFTKALTTADFQLARTRIGMFQSNPK